MTIYGDMQQTFKAHGLACQLLRWGYTAPVCVCVHMCVHVRVCVCMCACVYVCTSHHFLTSSKSDDQLAIH